MPIRRIIGWYEKYEKVVSPISLVGGFIFDAVYLERVDLFLENFWIIAHLAMAGAGIIALNLFEKGKQSSGMAEEVRSRIHFWIIVFIQFAFGGLLSTFLVFYFRSATFSQSWPFLLLLTIVFISNEIFKKQYLRLSFQVGVLFLSIYAFLIYFIPVLVHKIDKATFVLSGIASVGCILVFILVLRLLMGELYKKGRKTMYAGIIFILVAVNTLYFTNLIPPIPISLKSAGVYHSVVKNAEGNYDVTYEEGDWRDYFKLYDDYSLVSGEPVYVYSAIFSPTDFDTRIAYVWKKYDEKNKKWNAVTRVELPIRGGRDGGYRTYSLKSAVTPGKWTVDVVTMTGQVVGRVRFIAHSATSTPILAKKTLE